MDVIEKIDSLRKQKGWSVYKLAEECSLTQSTLSNMFIRKTQPTISTLTSICNGLGITLSQFFAESNIEKQNQEEIDLLNDYKKLSAKNKNAVKQLIKNLN